MADYDASQAGSNAADSGPIARPDVDALPAGSYGPASGNAITGAGTLTGNSGADSQGAAPAAIVEVHGAGGATSGSDGNFQANGQYGVLSMDAQGNYNYVRNPGTPDGVRDVFAYTLADAQGSRSPSTLTIDIGQLGTAVAQNAVNLPAGVELSDIHVVGRDLVIDMPDGTHLVIPNGAVFVPQLSIGDVSVPASNVAALLIDNEPQPAAGNTPSSGGNFADPVPPLDPGIPLGDLIPPTELTYHPPEFKPEGQFIDREPTIEIQPDGQPASVAAVDDVNEKGLPTRNGSEPAGSGEIADDNGSNNSDTSETTAGTIIIDSPDGVGSVMINGVLVTGVAGQEIDGAFGTLTITGFSGSNILYSYTLNDNTSGDNTHDDFSVTVTDDDGDQATATLTIDIIDDVPTARNDTDAVAKGDESTDGNVLTGANTTSGAAGHDTPGADDLPNGVTGIHAGGGSGSFTAVTSGGVLVHGNFGDLVIHADGSYTYTINGEQGAGGNDVFTYQITDGDGDTSTATLTITVPPDSIPVANNATALVDDDGLPLGNHDSAPGDDTQNPDPDNNESTFSGTLTANFGTDGPGTFTWGSDMDGKVVTIGQEQVTYHVVGNVLTAEVSDGARTGTDLFTATLNADGTYSVQLLNNVLQVNDGTNTENNATASLTFTAHDSDNDTGNGTLTITLDDDIPTAKPPIPPEEGGDPTPLVTGQVDEDALSPNGNNDSAPGDDPGGTTASGGVGSLGALFNAGADAPLTFSLSDVTSGLPTLHSDGALVTYDVSGNVLTASANGSTVFTLTVNADGSWTFELDGQLDHPVTGTEDNLLLDLSSVVVATDADGDSVGANAGVFVIDVDDDMPAQQEGGVTARVDEDELSNGITDNDAQTTVATGSLSGQVSFGADQPGTFGFDANALANLPALTSGGAAIHYAIVGGALVAYTGNDSSQNHVFTVSLTSGGNFTVTLLEQVDHLPNSPANDDNQTLTIDLSGIVTATDADGDTIHLDARSFVVSIEDDVPVAQNDTDDITGGGTTATGNVITGADTTSGVAGADSSGADAPIKIVAINSASHGTDTTFASGLLEIAGDHGTLTIDADGNYTYTRTDNLGGVSDTFTYTIQDADGDQTTATLTINVEDNVPVANTPAEVWLDDDTMTGGNAGGTGDRTPDTQNTTGTLTATGGDGDIDFYLTASQSLPTGFTSAFDGSAPAGQQWLIISQGGTPVIKVTLVNETGDYTVTQLAPIDHALDGNTEGETLLNNLISQINVSFYAQDADGDHSTNKNLTITVDDDTPAQTSSVITAHVDEDELTGGNTDGDAQTTVATGSLSTLVSVGADQPGTFSFDAGALGGLPSLTSNGAAIHYAIVSGTLVAYTGADSSLNHVFTVSLTSGGNYTVTLLDQVDHLPNSPANDDNQNLTIDLSGIVQVTDSDGDVLHLDGGSFNVQIEDDIPTQTSATVTAHVDEDELTGGNTDGDAQTTVATGSISGLASVGADQPGTFTFDAAALGGLPSLTSNGAAIHYAVVSGTLVAYTGADPASNQVFTVSLTSGGNFTVTLLDQVDHLPNSPANDDNQNLTIDLSGVVQVTDADGDVIHLDAGSFNVQIEDDIPTQNSATAVAHVDEDELTGGNTDGDAQTTVATGSISGLASVGADQPGSFTFDAAALGGLPALTSGGAAIHYAVVGGVLVGYTGANSATNHVFEVSLTSGGNYTVTLLDNIDHLPNSPANDDNQNLTIDLSGAVKVTDADGDVIHLDAGSFTVQIEDDIPTLGTIQPITTDDNPTDTNVTIKDGQGSLHLSMGADGFASVVISPDLTDITSGGHALIGSQTGNVYTAYADVDGSGTINAGDTAVFTITVDPNGGTSGTYTFDLLQALDGTTVDTPIGGSSAFGAGPTGFQVLDDGASHPLSVVTGYNTTASFNEATWLATGNLTSAMITDNSVNGSTSGWGVADNNFNGTNELIFFDFGAQTLADPDGAGGIDPNSSGASLPNISFATFDFINYNAPDDIKYVVHFTDGTFVSGTIPNSVLDNSSNDPSTNWTFTAPSGKFIADIDFFTSGVDPGKIDLVSVGVQSTNHDITIPVDMTFTDGDGDTVSGSTTIHVVDGATATTPNAVVNSTMTTNSLSTSSVMSSTLVSTNDNDHRAGNNAATLAAVAAFGLSTAQEAAAQTAHGHAGPSSHSAPIMAPDTFSATQVASRDSGSEHSIAPHSAHGVASDHVMATTSLSSAGTQANTHGLAGQAHGGHEAVTQLLAGTESHAASHGPAPVTSAAIAIPSAQQLAAHMGHGADKAASVDAAAVHTDGAVAKVLADALAGGHGHGPNIDALLHNAATHGHAQDALAALASHDAGSVSNGHSGVFGGFHNAPIMEIMASHQDAMPAHS